MTPEDKKAKEMRRVKVDEPPHINKKTELTETEQKRRKDRLIQTTQECSLVSQGYKFKASAWIHNPTDNAYNHDFYYKTKPSHQKIQEDIKRRGSINLTDYNITELHQQTIPETKTEVKKK
jgi:hypothetical protein